MSWSVEHTVLWWTLLIATVVGGIIMAEMDDAEGAGTPIWVPEEYMIDEDPTSAKGSVGAARGPNNFLYRVWQDDDYAIVVSWTENNGSSWTDSVVINSVWKAHTFVSLGGICVLANNTTLVHFTALNADDAYNSYIACRWEWAGAWDIITVYGGAASGGSAPKMAVNETHVLMTYFLANNIAYKVFDPSDSTVDPIAEDLPTMWFEAADTNSYNYAITVNQTGIFIIARNTWGGTFYRYYTRDLYGEHAAIYIQEPWGLYQMYGAQLVCNSDDLLALGAIMLGGGNYWIVHFYETTPWGAFSYRVINSNSADKDVYSLGVSLSVNDYLTYYFANGTGSGEQVEVSKTTALIDSSEETWEVGIIDAVYDYGTDTDGWYSHGWYNGKYPVVGGYSVNIPQTGWMGGHIWMDEVGTPDDYAFALYWNATFYWYDVEEEEEEEEEDDEEGPDPGIDWNINPDVFIGLLWMIFITLCVSIALMDKVQEISGRRKGG